MVVGILPVVKKNDRAGLHRIEHPAGYLVGRWVFPISWDDVPCHCLHAVTRNSMQLPRSVEAVGRTIYGRTDSGCRGNRVFRLPKLAVMRIDERIAFVMAIRMVAYEVPLSREAADNIRMRFCVYADCEECALHSVIVQCFCDPQRPGIIRSVVEGDRNFRSVARTMG